MIKIKIGEAERSIEQVTPSWLREQIQDRRNNHSSVCVRVIIQSGSINMTLSSAGCPVSNVSGRAPYPQEKEIFDLWSKRGLDDSEFNVGQLNAFLNEIQSRF